MSLIFFDKINGKYFLSKILLSLKVSLIISVYFKINNEYNFETTLEISPKIIGIL